MVKVVYNDCFGGFSVSRAAVLRAREISGDPKWGGACNKWHWDHQDHCKPLSRGGSHHISNVAPSCAACNYRKGTRTLYPKRRHPFMVPA